MDPAAAFVRWLDAINAPPGSTPTRDTPRRRPLLDAAVTVDVHMDRHSPAPRDAAPAPVVETFDGIERVWGWIERTPPIIVFTLVGAPVADGDAWRIEYALCVEDYRNGGVWRARLDPAGRIAFLSHRPFPLPEGA